MTSNLANDAAKCDSRGVETGGDPPKQPCTSSPAATEEPTREKVEQGPPTPAKEATSCHPVKDSSNAETAKGGATGKSTSDAVKLLPSFTRGVLASICKGKEGRKEGSSDGAEETAKIQTPSTPPKEPKDKGLVYNILGKKLFKSSEQEREGQEAPVYSETTEEVQTTKAVKDARTELKKNDQSTVTRDQTEQDKSGEEGKLKEGATKGEGSLGLLSTLTKIIGRKVADTEQKGEANKDTVEGSTPDVNAAAPPVVQEGPKETEEATKSAGPLLAILKKVTPLGDQEKKSEDAKKEAKEGQHTGIIGQLLDGIKAKVSESKEKEPKESQTAVANVPTLAKDAPVTEQEGSVQAIVRNKSEEGSKRAQESAASSPKWKHRVSALFTKSSSSRQGSDDNEAATAVDCIPAKAESKPPQDGPNESDNSTAPITPSK